MNKKTQKLLAWLDFYKQSTHENLVRDNYKIVKTLRQIRSSICRGSNLTSKEFMDGFEDNSEKYLNSEMSFKNFCNYVNA